MFNVICKLKEEKKNSTNVLEVKSVDNKSGFGCIEIKIGNESIIVDGRELKTAVDNCMTNNGYYRPARRYRVESDDENEE